MLVCREQAAEDTRALQKGVNGQRADAEPPGDFHAEGKTQSQYGGCIFFTSSV